ncbi:UdgX family uracil-DNA binding protein [Kaistia geumhonensis]|uniref:Type-4 uracil-DNA glycosylase n=1 Tax=Kaistia geumhonensis TaxID=410839 RepID=A0ABU0MA09_9HYPH|nr:UdgX family uracil-DNA binding protein [Kaistia geumhonensis]MCX5480489.1 UdgX family uracil-DNA binding protein [Kaistia geumhonensis]MDQ0517811.1 DNA polymerase [Kaistia geumhonensis]
MKRRVELQEGADLDGFRRAARALFAGQVPPEDIVWTTGGIPALFGEGQVPEAPRLALPRAVADLVGLVVCHRDPERYALLYALIWRVLHGERDLLTLASDPLVHRLAMMAKTIRRDVHKMHAFVRFRAVPADGGEHFVAWFEPDHFVLALAAPFFVDRFRGMRWSILTPVGSLHWDTVALAIGPAADRRDAAGGDIIEESWRGYYESAFNPARVNPALMRAEMPKRYWRNLPEANLIPGLVRSAASRVGEMTERAAVPSAKRNPEKAVAAMSDQDPKTLEALNSLIAASEPMVKGGTRAVLGEGPIGADIAFVGEQPGDQEDIEGRPFVGPAGVMLDRAMREVGIARSRVYVTNAVKHFKYEQRGKRRLHQSPTAGEVKHYRWWLMRELAFVEPKLVVALGATAVLALTGKALPVTRMRGPHELGGHKGFITVHPSYLLRIPDPSAKEAAYAQFLDDLSAVRALSAEVER